MVRFIVNMEECFQYISIVNINGNSNNKSIDSLIKLRHSTGKTKMACLRNIPTYFHNVPTATQGAYCKKGAYCYKNCLILDKMPTVKQRAYCCTSGLLLHKVPTAIKVA